MVKVKNMTSSNGNKIANQFEIETDDAYYFQSYDSVIAKIQKNNGAVVLDGKFWDYSKTTGRYRNIFLNATKKETQKCIDNGEYILANLN